MKEGNGTALVTRGNSLGGAVGGGTGPASRGSSTADKLREFLGATVRVLPQDRAIASTQLQEPTASERHCSVEKFYRSHDSHPEVLAT